MFPSFRQRIMILLGVIVAGWIYVRIAPAAQAADGREGLTLLASAMPILAVMKFALVMLLAAIVGAFVGAWGNPLAGVFTMATALACAAVAGGGIDQWLGRVDSSRIYLTWAVEAGLWTALVWSLGSMCLEGGSRLRSRVRSLTDDSDQLSADSPTSDRESQDQPSAATRDPIRRLLADTRTLPKAVQTGGALAAAMIVGSIAGSILMPTSDTWQVVWGLIVAYAIAGLVADQLFPRAQPMAILLSPLCSAVLWYLLAGLTGGEGDAMLQAYYTGQLWHMALALPIHYASAGVAGAAVGIGWSRYLGGGATGVAQAPEPEANVGAA